VRLCAKTEVVRPSANAVPSPSATELCYCKVKLFRDHGAERKLSNDVAHVKKTIEKLQQQIAQAETGVRDFGKKRKSPPSVAAKAAAVPGKPGKALKHKRTWSMSSNDSGGVRSPAEDDLHQKLATMQDMFTSTRPSSVLYLPGAEQDDPDLHPVRLTGEPLDLTKSEYTNEMWSRRSSAATGSKGDPSSLVSPMSNTSGNVPQVPSAGPPQPPPRDSEWTHASSMHQADLQSNPQHLASPPDQTVKVPRNASDASGHLAGYIDAVGVDRSYQPPPVDPALKPGKSVLAFAPHNLQRARPAD
jgi:hypothetical protein